MEKLNREDKFISLRAQYPLFVYEDYSYSMNDDKTRLEIKFNFSANEHKFTPTVKLAINSLFTNEDFENQIDTIVFNMGMIELISYWKCVASPNVKILCGSLTEKQIAFWKKLYFNGLGEYFYLNEIETDIDSFMSIASAGKQYSKIDYQINQNRVIVPVGGGKDSVVTLEMMKKGGFEVLPLIVNPRGATLNCVEIAGFSQFISIQRTIDVHLLELNAQGYLNGHTPFSAMLAFTTLLAGVATNCADIALSNENSANESTVKGESINHQYSKSIEFERDFREYYQDFIGKGFNYFSFLRPLSELQIAQYFAMYPQYHSVFRSCNAGSKEDKWCCNCAKCLFAYIILSPFITPNRLEEYFGENLLNKEVLKEEFLKLIGQTEVKPFECVGTVDEVNQALSLLVFRYKNCKDLALVRLWLTLPQYTQYRYLKRKILYKINDDNFLLSKYKALYGNTYATFNTSEILRRFAKKSIVIFGFGREGRSTYNFLRQNCPNMPLAIQDDNTDLQRETTLLADVNKGNLILYTGEEAQFNHEADVIIKSPGVNIAKMRRPYRLARLSSQTEFFLRQYAQQCVGITGTKGKSTTSTLAYTMIKAAHPNTLFAGNIGKPMFDLIPLIDRDTIIVLELSAHQLQFVKHAPRIAALLNLYEEHLDYFGSFRAYMEAKFNILRYQYKDSAFFYNEDDENICEYVSHHQNTMHKLNPVSVKDYNLPEPLYLAGEHNKFNFLVAYKIVEQLGFAGQDALEAGLNFKGLDHRLQFVADKGGVKYYNDSISTIPQATLAAMNSLQGVQTLILGGNDRGIDYSPIENIINDFDTLQNIAFVGKAGRRMKEIIDQASQREYKAFVSDDYKAVVDFCKQNTQEGNICLLSPAASSYDMFKNFEQRGSVFTQLVIQG